MRKTILLALSASLFLSTCGWRESRLNPRNWFGDSREVAAVRPEQEANPLIPKRRGAFARPDRPDLSVPIDSVTELKVEPTLTGAIISATGIAARQGAYQARLVPETPGLEPVDGVLSFTFRVLYPRRPTPRGSEFSRTVHDAFSISKDDLAGVRVIRVVAAQNARESRRR